MKIFLPKTIGFIVICLFLNAGNLKAQGVFLNDGTFHTYIVQHYTSCIFPDNSIDVTCSAIVNEDTLNLSGFGIGDYDGLQYFTSLRYLDVSNNPGSLGPGGYTIPSAAYTNLKVFKCSGDIGITWPFPNLEYLDCSYTGEAPLQNPVPFFPATLKYLNCSENYYYGGISAGPVMDTLICSNNGNYFGPGFYTGLTSVGGGPSLRYLDCSGNILSSISINSNLVYLDCSNNIETYDVGGSSETVGGLYAIPTPGPNLKYLSCGGNYINSLPALPSTLEYLSCPSYNNSGTAFLTSLPALPSVLRTLDIQANNITTLQPLPDSLRELSIGGNVNLGCLPHLPAHLTSLNTINTGIHCIPNSVNGLSASLPLCTVTNNSNLCISFPVLSGRVFYDNNSDGIREPSENYRANIAINVSNGLETFSNTHGYYEVTADTGANTLTVVPPVYYDPVPATYNFNMPAFTSLATQDIALQPNTSVDALNLSVTPAWFARPGSDQNYDVDYENTGTTTVNPSTVFHYDNTRLVFLAASVGGVVDNGSSLTYTQTNVTPGDHGGFTALFHVKQTDIPGDTIFVNVATTAGIITVTDSAYTRITASLDPNDKYATPKLTPQQVASGTYINYLVRFQNTGTDTAFNIVLTDLLDNKLDASSLQMIKSSHPCKVTRNGNNLSFEFLDILLPYQSENEAMSHGYVRFRVNPNPSVVLNDVIPNKANIYFDFNSPVFTNTANTLIQLTTVPLHLLSFKVFTNNDNEALLYWNTENEVNTMSFDVEQSTDGRNFNKAGTVAARGQGNNNYDFKTNIVSDIVYYRLKMIDIDGKFAFSQVVQVRRDKHSESIILLSNPVKNTLSFSVNDVTLINTTANLINEQGVVVKKFVLKDGLQNIDVSNLSTGIYYLKTNTITKKIIINH